MPLTEEWTDVKRPLLGLCLHKHRQSLDLSDSDPRGQVMACGFPVFVDGELRKICFCVFHAY